MALNYRVMLKDASHIILLIALVGIVLGLITWTGIIDCAKLPAWCDVYYTFVCSPTELCIPPEPANKPRVLIVFGDEGLGDPDLLQMTMADPNHLGVRAQKISIDQISLGNLKKYHLVIVEHARKMKTSQLKMFMDYVNVGGRLVWIGDAGTELGMERDTPDEYLYEDEKNGSGTHTIISPWARKDDQNNMILFNEFLSVNYLENYCNVKDCSDDVPWIGSMQVPDNDNPLVYGLGVNLQMHGDFAIVEEISTAVTTRVMTVNALSNIIGTDGKNYGKFFPIIERAGTGQRVAYYAIPPETFVKETQKDKYYTFISNMYFGMLFGRGSIKLP